MPIPNFDPIYNIIPPLPNNTMGPGFNGGVYSTDPMELCTRFNTSDSRRRILQGFFNLRRDLRNLGVVGFHWIDGSFVENIEAQASRPPGDIDVVTFISSPNLVALGAILSANREIFINRESKLKYRVDHFSVPLTTNPHILLNHTKYWLALFSHRKGDFRWKGMLELKLNLDPNEDQMAIQSLGI